MDEVIKHFKRAKQKRVEANQVSALKPSKKLALADEALDAMELVTAGLISEVIDLKEQLSEVCHG
jgi:ATP-dependent protease ClpP protease subunit